MEKSLHGGREWDRVRGADDTDRDRIDDGSVAARDHSIQPIAIPRRARDVDKRASLRRGLQLAFARGRKGRSKLRYVPQACIVTRRRGPVRMRKKYAVAKSRPLPEHRRKPIAQRCGVNDIAG